MPTTLTYLCTLPSYLSPMRSAGEFSRAARDLGLIGECMDKSQLEAVYQVCVKTHILAIVFLAIVSYTLMTV